MGKVSAFRVAAVASTLACVPIGWLARQGDPASTALAITAAFVPYTLLLVLRAPEREDAWRLSLLPGLVMVVSASVLSEDVYRYAWDARVLLAGLDPYAHAPEAAALSGLRDTDYAHINHRHIATIYPPLAQLWFALGAVAGGTTGLKLLALLAHLASAWLVGRVAGRMGDARQATRATHLLALNPLALSEAALGGHVDAVVGLGVCALALSLVDGKAYRAALWIGALSGLKLVGLALWPLLLRRGALPTLLAIALGLLALWPTTRAGHADAGLGAPGVGHYSQRWRGNDSGFGALQGIARAWVRRTADAPDEDMGPDEVRPAWLAPLLRELAGTRFDLQLSFRGEKKAARDPTIVHVDHLARLLAQSLAVALVIGLGLGAAWGRVAPLTTLRLLLWAILLLSPQVHPWYLLWLLPLELACGGHAALVWSAAATVAYAPLSAWQAARLWQEHPLALQGQYAVVGMALILGAWAAWSRRKHGTAYM